MHFRVRHHTLYRYDLPVTLGAHTVRLIPRPEGIRLLSHRFDIEPEPLSRRAESDAFGNQVLVLDFNHTTQYLRIDSALELVTLAPPPLTLALAPLPWPAPSNDALGAYRIAGGDTSVREFAESVAAEAGHEPLAFLDRLTETLFTRLDRHVRHSGEARSAGETLRLGSGACRDVTVLFLEVCRTQGLAARFVSGYQAQADTPDGSRYLHAWSEVFLPGAGWRGWDAMHGLRVSEGHVALCAAPTQAGTMPVEGAFSFQGSTLNSTLDHAVYIETGSA